MIAGSLKTMTLVEPKSKKWKIQRPEQKYFFSGLTFLFVLCYNINDDVHPSTNSMSAQFKQVGVYYFGFKKILVDNVILIVLSTHLH